MQIGPVLRRQIGIDRRPHHRVDKPKRLTRNEIELYQLVESGAAAKQFGYVESLDWYAAWLCRLRLAGAETDPAWKYNDAMVQIALAPCSPFSVTTSLMRATATLADKLDVRLHTHLAETEDENKFCEQMHGCRPLDYLEQCGWLNARTWLAHGIFFNPDEMKRLGKDPNPYRLAFLQFIGVADTDQEAYRQQEWDASGLEKREQPPEGMEKEYEWHQGQRPRLSPGRVPGESPLGPHVPRTAPGRSRAGPPSNLTTGRLSILPMASAWKDDPCRLSSLS